MLKLKNIDVFYGKIHAIKHVSLHVDEGASLFAQTVGKIRFSDHLRTHGPNRAVIFSESDITRRLPRRSSLGISMC